MIDHKDFEMRMRQELAIPFWNLKANKSQFTETEFQKMKSQLMADIETYAESYVNPSENE